MYRWPYTGNHQWPSPDVKLCSPTRFTGVLRLLTPRPKPETILGHIEQSAVDRPVQPSLKFFVVSVAPVRPGLTYRKALREKAGVVGCEEKTKMRLNDPQLRTAQARLELYVRMTKHHYGCINELSRHDLILVRHRTVGLLNRTVMWMLYYPLPRSPSGWWVCRTKSLTGLEGRQLAAVSAASPEASISCNVWEYSVVERACL